MVVGNTRSPVFKMPTPHCVVIAPTMYAGLFRISVIQSCWRAYRGGFSGNMEGDGTLLGGSLVVGPGEQGVLFEYHSVEFGDHAPHEDIVEAVSRIKNN